MNVDTRGTAASRRHLSNKPRTIMAASVMLLLMALSLLTVVPLAAGHPRASNGNPDTNDTGAPLPSPESDGPANRTARPLSRTIAPQTNLRPRKLPVQRINGNMSQIVPGNAAGHRRKIHPVRVHHHGIRPARAGRNTVGDLDDRSAYARNSQRHHTKAILRSPSVNPQQQQNQRVYENVQRGSITLPAGSDVFLEPNDNRTLAFSSQSDPTIYRPRTVGQPRRKNGQHQQGHGHRAKGVMTSAGRRRGLAMQQKFTVIDGLCISCPPEKTAVAREGLDGVLIEPPVLATCTGRPISKDLYELETLFGPKFNFVLPHSNGAPYSFLAKVVSKLTGNTVLTCDLRYRVVVKQCRRYKPKNRDLKVSCSLNSIWGSRCTFHCRSGGYLSRPNAFVKCGANEIWEGEEPYCTFNDVSDDYAADSADPSNASTTDCQLDIPPAYGRFACDLKDTESASNELAIPNGTACQVMCNEGHYIPTHLQPAAYFGCIDGRWNNTMRHFCYKTTQIANGNSQRHRGYG